MTPRTETLAPLALARRPRIERRSAVGADLTEAELAEAHAFFTRFVRIPALTLAESLRRKAWVVTWRDAASGELLGLLAISVKPLETPDGRRIVVIGNHHVALDDRLRGRNALQWANLRAIGRVALRYPRRRIFWTFDTWSFRVYLAMTRTFPRCWPAPDRPLPDRERAWLNDLMKDEPAFDPDAGLVRWPDRGPQPGTLAIDDRALEDPDVRFFVDANPGWARGDGLVCVAPMSPSNIGEGLWRRVVARRRAGKPVR